MNLKKILLLAGLSIAFLVLILVTMSVISNMTKSLNSDYKLVDTWKGNKKKKRKLIIEHCL